jgi:hypothetical protein
MNRKTTRRAFLSAASAVTGSAAFAASAESGGGLGFQDDIHLASVLPDSLSKNTPGEITA